MLFIILRNFSSIPGLSVFYHEKILDFVKCFFFFMSVEMIMWFLSFICMTFFESLTFSEQLLCTRNA